MSDNQIKAQVYNATMQALHGAVPYTIIGFSSHGYITAWEHGSGKCAIH